MAEAGRPRGSVSIRNSHNPNVPQCKSCRMIPGGDLCREILMDYRGHTICSHCKAEWEKREKQLGREISWEELLKGTIDITETVLAKQRRREAIRLELSQGKTLTDVAKLFNLSPRTVSRARRGGK